MSPRHATFGNHIVVESPKPSAATLHPISGPKPSQLGNHGLAVRKYEETFPVEPRSPSRSLRQNSGHRWTSEWSVSEYYDREPRFFWFYSDRQKPGGTAYIPKSTEDIPSFNDAPLMSFGPLSSPGEASSTVNAYKCKSSLSETDYVAVKEVECVRPEEQEAALKELRLLEGLEHRHIVACVGGYYLEDRFHIVQYPVAKYNLVGFLLARSTYLQFQRGDLVREREHRARIGTYFSCLCNALVYLSTKGVKHRDVKPENILIDKDNSILLTDFDRSRTDLKTVARTEDVTACTVRYSCRQVCQGESRDIKSDVFSLGCVFLEMATVMLGKPVRELYESIGSFPRNGVCEFAYWESVVEGKIDTWITTLVECSRHMRDGRDALASTQAGGEYHEKVLDKDHLNMIKRMMSDDNDERPTLDEVQLAFADLADDCRACQISNSIPAIYSMRLVSLSSSSSAEPSRSTVVRASLSNRLSVEPLETSRVRDLPTIEERHTPTSDDSTPTKDKDAVASMLLQGAGGANRMQRTGSESKQRVVGLAESPSRVFPTTNENNGPSQDVSTSAPLPRNQLVDASRASSRERGVHRTRSTWPRRDNLNRNYIPDKNMQDGSRSIPVRESHRALRSRSPAEESVLMRRRSQAESHPKIRMIKHGTPGFHNFPDVKAIPGRRVIEYDPITEQFKVVPKEQLDFTDGILIRLPRTNGWKFKTVNSEVNLWKCLKISENMRRMSGNIRLLFQKGKYTTSLLLQATGV